jgi:hypothetical protein
MSQVPRLLDPGIVSGLPWIGSHDSGAAHRHLEVRMLARLLREKENDRAVGIRWSAA